MAADIESHWVFGYGSLMWRPGFDYEEKRSGIVKGLHRSLCVYSHVHRGTPEKPGLVIGLDRGGSCRGIAFRIDAGKWVATLDYLRKREQVTMVYKEARRLVHLDGEDGKPVLAVTFIVDRRHPQYAGKLPLESQLAYILQGEGVSGRNPDYVLSTADHLTELGLHDPVLHALANKIRLLSGARLGD